MKSSVINEIKETIKEYDFRISFDEFVQRMREKQDPFFLNILCIRNINFSNSFLDEFKDYINWKGFIKRRGKTLSVKTVNKFFKYLKESLQ